MDEKDLLRRVVKGRTDLVFDLIAGGTAANATDGGGVALIKWCAYYGDVSAIRFLLAHGEALASLGQNLDLNGAAFHGHWRLVQFLVESGADVNLPLEDTGETPLHAALCKSDRTPYDLVLRVLLSAGARPNVRTKAGAATGAFMRDARTQGETPLHRAAAFGTPETIRLLLDAGADAEARDANGDTPLAWASWHGRPADVLSELCYGPHRVSPGYAGLRAHLLGEPVRPGE